MLKPSNFWWVQKNARVGPFFSGGSNQVTSPHALRHTALTLLAKAGVELIDLKALAGHQDVATTMIYLHSVQSYEDHVGLHNPINI
jgi:site-specific recombinase XerD